MAIIGLEMIRSILILLVLFTSGQLIPGISHSPMKSGLDTEPDTIPGLYYSIGYNIGTLADLEAEINSESPGMNIITRRDDLFSTIQKQIDSLRNLDIPWKNELLEEIYYCAEFWELKTVKEYLTKNGIVQTKEPNKEHAVIDTSDWKNFSGNLIITKSGRVLSRTFEEYSTQKVSRYEHVPLGIERFRGSSYKRQRYFVENTMFAVLPGQGFESVRHVFTIWKNIQDRYYLQTILDNWLCEGIGGIWIEDVFPIDSKRQVILGRSGGGDQGDSWGSIWIGVWEKPDHLRVIYYRHYSIPFNDSISRRILYSTRINKSNSIVEIDKTVTHFSWNGFKATTIDSLCQRYVVDIKSIIDSDLTQEYNFHRTLNND